MAEPVVYGPAYSTYTRTVRLTLAEKGVSYRLEEIDFIRERGVNTTPEHLARHPFAKVPAFEHDGFVLYETGAIARYVDEAFDGVALQPADVRARARMAQAIAIVDAYAYPVLVHKIYVPWTRGRKVAEDVLPRALTCIDALAAVLGDNTYLAGAEPSLADFHLVPVFDYFRQAPEAERLLASAPSIERWWTSVADRPSVAKTAPPAD